ncbi:hypothetical protein [Caldisphaera sp.]|uniref:hypothetical protein n=1 Tax=Caldisphaera sp. TaxID=2060322 RepID=UPI0025BE2338|nr:hypothetical protein [Caldisphaera sp.]
MARTEFVNFVYSADQTQPVEIQQSGVYLEPGQEVVLDYNVPEDGLIFNIIIQIPSGVNGTTLFRLILNSKQIFPSQGYFTGNGTVLQIPVYINVKAGDKLQLDVINRGSNPHWVSVQVGIIFS